jgi:hypothetical protein
MTHPTREDWMAYLYDECPADNRATLQTHLHSCGECRAQLAVWQSAGGKLDDWKLPARRKVRRAATLTRWAIAAAIVAIATMGGARILALNDQVKQLRAEVQRNTAHVSEQAANAARAEAQMLVTALAQQSEQKRLTDQQTTLAALQQLSARHAQDYGTLRKELETVAVFSEAGLQRAENQISSLASTPVSFSENK